ncbi:alpha/beta fold hydrolase [Flavobacteriaceae bacterium GF1]
MKKEYTTNVNEKLNYYLYYPKNYDSSKPDGHALLVFLHGGGESGDNLDDLKKNGIPKLISEGKDFPFIVLAPQNPHMRKWWNVHLVNRLIDEIATSHKVDKQRVYLTGMSRGGGAAWSLAVQYPKKWAALAVVCGMAPVPYAQWIDKELPIWVFHGRKDKAIPITESDNMVGKLKAMGYDVRYTIYDDVGHDAWTRAYATQDLYDWFAQKRRKEH